jgi:predicted Zn-dependent protease
MRKTLIRSSMLVVTLAVATPSFAQIGRIIDRAEKAKAAVDDYNFTEEEERSLGQGISEKLREKYGVVQNRDVHKYVTLVGRVLAQESSRPNLNWTFIVLDTDGVNAFAAPGGFVHLTKGALALIDSEAELADVLGHEIGHVVEKHTVNAIKKAKGVSLGASATRNDFIQGAVNKGYEMTLENKFDRGEENEADTVGITLANKAGYAPTALAMFLTKLSDRNKDLKERSGMFASHPEAKARLDNLDRVITRQKLTATAMVTARFDAAISYVPVPVSTIPQTAPPSASASADSGSSGGAAPDSPRSTRSAASGRATRRYRRPDRAVSIPTAMRGADRTRARSVSR